MNNKPLLSVIIPVYNTAKYIEKCLDSVLNQSYSNLQVIIIDDGSTDESLSFCCKYASKDKRITLIKSKNKGAAGARNIALKYVKGDYLTFVDSDDWVDLESYSTMMNSILSSHSDIVLCGRFNVNDNSVSDGFNIDDTHIFKGVELLKKMMNYDRCDFALWDKIYKSYLWNNITFPTGFTCEDIPVLYDLFLKASSVISVGKRLYYHVYHNKSVSAQRFSEHVFDFEFFTYRILKDCEDNHKDLLEDAKYFRLKSLIYSISFTGKVDRLTYKNNKNGFYSNIFELKTYKKIMNIRQKIIYYASITKFARIYYYLVYFWRSKNG